MSRLVVVAPVALDDLSDVRDHRLLKAGRRTTARVIAALHDAMNGLAVGTIVGHPRADLADPPALFYLVFDYFIRFRLDAGKVMVSRVEHGAQNIRAMIV